MSALLEADPTPGVASPAVGWQTRWLRLSTSLLATRLTGQGLEFVAWVVLARRLGAGAFGVLAVALLACRYAGLVADWGATLRGPRDVAAATDPARVAQLVRFRAGAALALGLAFAAATLVTRHASLAPLAVTIAGRGLNRDWIALGREGGLRSGIPPVVQGSTAILFALAFGRRLVGATSALAAAYGAAALASVLLNRLPRILAAEGSAPSRSRLPGASMLVVLVSDQVMASLDTVLLAAVRSSTAAGVYAAVYRIPNAWLTVLGLILAAAVPLLTRARERGMAEFARVAGEAQRVTRRLALGLFLLAPLSWPAATLVFGPAYADGRLSLLFLLVASAATTVAAGYQLVLLALDADRRLAAIYLAAALLGVTLYAILIPWLGMVGAALATLLTQATLAVTLRSQTIALRRRLAATAPS